MSELHIESRDFWVKTIDVLYQNWAVVNVGADGLATIYFMDGAGGVFDELPIESISSAATSLTRNGFVRYADSKDLHVRVKPPPSTYHRRLHPNGRVYSSNTTWKE